MAASMDNGNPRVAVFTSIQNIADSLRKAAPDMPLDEIIDTTALGGYGGTVDFDPTRLAEETRAQLRAAEILITEPAVLASILDFDNNAFPNLKWCQSTYAGVDPLFQKNINMPLPFVLTRFAGKFGPPMAEWCMARIIAHERKFDLSTKDQGANAWAASKEVTSYRYLSDLTLTVLGCGDIGVYIARAAKAFGMHVVGYVRTKASRHQDIFDECVTNLQDALRKADYVISVLPSTPSTRGLLSADVFRSASVTQGGKSPVFLNVGRGDVTSEASLTQALDEKSISAAILDVVEIEPLPKESQLWSRPDVVISPHVSGLTRADDVPDLFLKNYGRYVNREPLQFVVDYGKGY